MDLEKIKELLPHCSEEDRAEIERLIESCNLPIWMPWPGRPQQDAYYCEADILFYGGAAGGGKTDLIIGLSLTSHTESVIFRKEGPQFRGILRRFKEILGSDEGFNGKDRFWRYEDKIIDFLSTPHTGTEEKQQGIPHDFIAFDEITHFPEYQFRFLTGWNRTTIKDQRCRIVCTGNPPTTSDGEWVLDFWGPWLQKDHPNPAKPGELRWYVSKDGKDIPVDGPEPVEVGGVLVKPRSRTFIPSKVTDNPALMETGYISVLQALPEPLRSQMLEGDFFAGLGSDPWQVIPTAWVEESMSKWDESGKRGPMDSLGADIARNGKAKTTIARRHGNWIDKILAYPGTDTPNGPMSAALIIAAVRDRAPSHVDVIGVGASTVDHLTLIGTHVVPIDSRASTNERDRNNNFGFFNERARLWWRAREALDPNYGEQLILPPIPELKRDLCAPRYEPSTRGIKIESKEDVEDRLGRPVDYGDSVIYSLEETEKRTSGNEFVDYYDEEEPLDPEAGW